MVFAESMLPEYRPDSEYSSVVAVADFVAVAAAAAVVVPLEPEPAPA